MTWHIGIDPGSRCVGLAAIREDGKIRYQAFHTTGELQDRFVQIRQHVRSWLSPLADEGVWNVVIEQPGTRHGGVALLGSFGVVLEATRSLLKDTVIHELPSASWKRLALGTGAATKAEVMEAAHRLGYPRSQNWQDIADALCIAKAAMVLIEANKDVAA